MSQKYFYLPRARLYSDNPRDREILEWLEGLPGGFKGDGIKDAIWASIGGIERVPKKPARSRSIDNGPPQGYSKTPNGTMSGSLTLDTRELLVDIRQVVEAVLTQTLAHHGTTTNSSAPHPEDEREIESLLDDLDMSFMLDDDDDEEE